MSYQTGAHHPRSRDLLSEIAALRSHLDHLILELLERSPGIGDLLPDETDDGWVLKAPVPGIAPDAVEIELTDRDLRIRGEAPGHDGPIDHRVALPDEIDIDRVEASLEHGVLTVTLPRPPGSVRRRIRLGTTPSPVTVLRTVEPPPEEQQTTEPLPRPRPSEPDTQPYDAQIITAPLDHQVVPVPAIDNHSTVDGDWAAQSLESDQPAQKPEQPQPWPEIDHPGSVTQPRREPSWLDWFSGEGERA